jgi:hypothetical protein
MNETANWANASGRSSVCGKFRQRDELIGDVFSVEMFDWMFPLLATRSTPKAASPKTGKGKTKDVLGDAVAIGVKTGFSTFVEKKN